jgi:hypothetical protein
MTAPGGANRTTSDARSSVANGAKADIAQRSYSVETDPKRKSARINTCTGLCVEIRFYVDRNGLSGSAHVGRLELVAIAGEHAHVTPRRNRTVVSCENT